jgi:CxxC-x17-CxxC domain-containing protein
MKKKSQVSPDIVEFMAKIQEQLAVMDRKLDSFMTKSLTELAQARAVQKPLQPQSPSRPPIVQQPSQPSARPPEQPQRVSRPMYAVVCFDCGKNTEIPFKPSGDRPVYCKECFTKRKAGNAPKVTEPKAARPRHSTCSTGGDRVKITSLQEETG